MAITPIFRDEDIIRAYIKDKLKSNFDNFTIEEIIELTKTAKYKDFAQSFKLNYNVKQLVSFRKREEFLQNIPNALLSELITERLSQSDLRNLKYK